MSTTNIYVQALAGSTVVVNGEQVVGLTDEDTVVSFEDILPDEAMSDDQRRALFAEWNEAFGRDTTRADRHNFTRAVLGEGFEPSWARDAGVSADQASQLIEVLRVVNSLI